MLNTICIPCKHGNHAACHGGQAPPEGLLGGWRCVCDHQGTDEREVRTWAEVIREAHEAVGAAQRQREAVLRAANEAGVTTRQIASALGVSAATAWRWLGNEPVDRKAALDAPADLSGVGT